MYRAISSDKSIRHLGTSSWKHFVAITALRLIDFATTTVRVVPEGLWKIPIESGSPSSCDDGSRSRDTVVPIWADKIFVYEEKEKWMVTECMLERKTLPLTSMWMVCESARPCLFLAVHVYAPRSVLLSTRCSTSVPFVDTSWRRLVGNIWPSVRKKN